MGDSGVFVSIRQHPQRDLSAKKRHLEQTLGKFYTLRVKCFSIFKGRATLSVIHV